MIADFILYLCAIKSKTMHIAVAGNIGSGKSTLTQLLAKHYGWEARFEAVEHNPYLEDYYRDIYRWSFNLEVYFLKERFRDLIDIAHADHTIIQDRTIYEGVYVFMENNKAMGHLSTAFLISEKFFAPSRKAVFVSVS